MPAEATVTQLHPRMSVPDYERERAALRETYGDSSTEAAAKRDQALAKLFYRTGWTQEELAKKESKGQQQVGRQLRFGRFLNFTPTGVNPESPPFVLPPKLTERKFRDYWERTDKTETNERIRFRAVMRLMEQEAALRRANRPKIGAAIVKQFADGKWHGTATIAKAMSTDEEHVAETLSTMQRLRGTYGAKCEKRHTVKETQYRIFRADRTIATSELRTKLHPIIKGLKAEGRKAAATMSVQTVATLAALLERTLIEWEEGIDPSSRRPDEFAAKFLGIKDDSDE